MKTVSQKSVNHQLRIFANSIYIFCEIDLWNRTNLQIIYRIWIIKLYSTWTNVFGTKIGGTPFRRVHVTKSIPLISIFKRIALHLPISMLTIKKLQ